MSQLPTESLPEYKSNTGFGESTINVDIVSPYAMHDHFDFNSRKNGYNRQQEYNSASRQNEKQKKEKPRRTVTAVNPKLYRSNEPWSSNSYSTNRDLSNNFQSINRQRSNTDRQLSSNAYRSNHGEQRRAYESSRQQTSPAKREGYTNRHTR